MKLSTTAKFLTVIAVFGAIAVSQADTFSVVESGTYSQVALNLSSSVNTTLVLSSSLPENITGATLSITEAAVPTPSGVAATGTVTLFGTTAADTLTFSFSGSVFSGATESLAASATLTGSAGAYAAYNSGTGNLAFQFLSLPGSSVAVGTISGNVQTVPEPVSLATLGVGLFGLAVRRKRN